MEPQVTPSRWSIWPLRIGNAALLISGVVNIVIGTWQVASAHTIESTSFLAAGLILIFASTMDRLEMLKGWGIEARTRKLDENIAESEQLLAKLRRIAELVGRFVVHTQSAMNRWDSGGRFRTTEERKDEVEALLREFATNESTIKEIVHPWIEWAAFDLEAYVRDEVRRAVMKRRIDLAAEAAKVAMTDDQSTEPERLRTLAQNYLDAENAANRITLHVGTSPQQHAALLREFAKHFKAFEPAFAAEISQIVDPWLDELVHLGTTGKLQSPLRWYPYMDSHGRAE